MLTTPKMILFDYGQTLANERKFDGVAGGRAILQHATKNKYNCTAEDLQAAADAINAELGDSIPSGGTYSRLKCRIICLRHSYISPWGLNCH